MTLYFRKSVSAGPFRFNFSSGGVGMSVGVRGLRVGTGPRGHYVQAGRNGFYYRASLGQPSGRQTVAASAPPYRVAGRRLADDRVEMVEVTSGDILAMEDSAFSEVLNELNEKHGQMKMAVVLPVIALVFGGILLAAAGPAGGIAMLMAPVAWAVGAWLDSYRRTAVLFYDVDEDAETGFTQICRTFDSLSACAGKWHIQAGGAVRDLTTWKREAGASHLVKRSATALGYSLPTVLKCNVTPPMLKVGRRTIYFLPDVALVEDASGFGAVGYHVLRLTWQPSNFIETESVPRDAQIVRHTWQHPNKNGGPDRRFRQNRQIPVCRYEALHIFSVNGMNELVEFSRVGFAEPFANALAAVPRNAKLGAVPALASAR
jgi:hypothetical protein